MTDVWRLYEKHAAEYARDRSRSLMEQRYLSAIRSGLSDGSSVLDLGCGMGEPIARYFMDNGFEITGIDAAPAMIALCEENLSGAAWITADMRTLDLGRRFDAVIAWDSFFHLDPNEQRALVPVFEKHTAPGGYLLFTSGPKAGEVIGDFYGNPLYHASLDEAEYRDLLSRAGFTVLRYQPEDPDCGGHTVWLAQAKVGIRRS